MKKQILINLILSSSTLIMNAQTSNTSPLPAGETVIGGHLHAGSGNEIWTDANQLFFNYRGNASATYFWNLGNNTGAPVMTLLSSGSVGIGVQAPDQNYRFTVSGINSSIFKLESTNEADINFVSGTSNWQVGTGFTSIGANKFFFYNTTSRMVIDEQGNVGIGTTNPTQKLAIAGRLNFAAYSTSIDDFGMWATTTEGTTISSAGNTNIVFRINNAERLRIDAVGNIGIGTNKPTDKLQIGEYNTTEQNNIALWSKFGGAGEQSKIKFKMLVEGGVSNSTIAEIVPSTYVNGGKNRLDFKVGEWNNDNNSGEAKLSILSNGNILIGKTEQQNSNYKLDVNGSIRANEIKVNLDGADFVFESDYKLRSLTELEKFVKEHKHLPEVATAKEMKENGTNLGDLNSKLLQKMEEMTLYMIEQNKKIQTLEEKIKRIESISK